MQPDVDRLTNCAEGRVNARVRSLVCAKGLMVTIEGGEERREGLMRRPTDATAGSVGSTRGHDIHCNCHDGVEDLRSSFS